MHTALMLSQRLVAIPRNDLELEVAGQVKLLGLVLAALLGSLASSLQPQSDP